jgi:predicted dehydrogenase
MVAHAGQVAHRRQGMLPRGDTRPTLAHSFDCLQSGGPFRTTIEDGVAAQRLAEAATESWQSGQVVRL